MVSQVAAFIARRWCVPLESVRVDVQPVHGGLESTVARVRISQPLGDGSIPPHFVVKQLPAGFEREADVYELLWRHFDPPPAVRLLGREIASQATYLYLEEAQPPAVWPWSDTRRAGAVCQALARLHDSQPLPQDVFSWDYEAQLARSAQATLELANTARDTSGRRLWRRIGDLRRVAAALPQMRDQLMTAGTCVVIHGDMHPGNVILRAGEDRDVLLIDWARARLGSPLEDVASWLHSLGCWEPEARRRHDTLMRIYLDARRDRRAFVSDVRVDYWFASASNGLSGAIRYHLAVLWDASRSEAARYDSWRALTAWQRVIRRVAALLGPTHGRRSRGSWLARRSATRSRSR